jgi:hypothetical protein
VHNIIPDYLEGDDGGTMGYGVAIVWYNPGYQPEAGVGRRVQPRSYNFDLRPMRAVKTR